MTGLKRMNRSLILGLAALTLSVTAAAAPMAASAAPVAIHFARGSTCWQYTGRAFQFTGRFMAGQTVRIRASGLATMGDGRRTWTERADRDPEMSFHNGATVPGDAGVFDVPATATYDIILWPHAMQGAPGTTVVCAR